MNLFDVINNKLDEYKEKKERENQIKLERKEIEDELNRIKKERDEELKYIKESIGKTCKLYSDEDFKKIKDFIGLNYERFDSKSLDGVNFSIVEIENYNSKDYFILELKSASPDKYIEEFIDYARSKGVKCGYNIYEDEKYKSKYNGDRYFELSFYLTITKKDIERHQGLINYINYVEKLKIENRERCKKFEERERLKREQKLKETNDYVKNIL